MKKWGTSMNNDKTDISEQDKWTEKIYEMWNLSNREFRKNIINQMFDAFALHRVIVGENGEPIDYEFIEINPAFEAFTGTKREDVIGRRVTEIIPGIEHDSTNWIKNYGNVGITGDPLCLIENSEALDRWYTINCYSPQPGYFIVIFHDISEIKRKEVELSQKNDELTSLYEELAASEEELRAQLEEIIDNEVRLQKSHDELELANKKLHDAQEELKKRYEEQKGYHSKLKDMAGRDYLTGIPNRFSLYEYFPAYLQKENTGKALLYIDADDFKYINDTMGHLTGDELIRQISRRLLELIGPQDSLFRLGGDEFIVCLGESSDNGEVEAAAHRLIQSFLAPFRLNNNMLHITASIGIALHPQHGRDLEGLMKCADIALYSAKDMGKNRVVFYETEMNEAVAQRMRIERHLRTALRNKEFSLNYQPVLDIETNSISGFEALLRWDNITLGSVPPNQFIKVAEDTHMIIPIGDWVLTEACKFIKSLHMQGYGDIGISVNISIIQLFQEDFYPKVMRMIEKIGLNPLKLQLEITESILMESYKEIKCKLELFREQGVQIALDDFGKGYSSLSYLRNLPITTLKIDKVFTDDILRNDDDSLMGTIVLLGQKMGLNVVAEGVETKEQMDYLKRYNCQNIQGYYYSRPLPENMVYEFIKE